MTCMSSVVPIGAGRGKIEGRIYPELTKRMEM